MFEKNKKFYADWRDRSGKRLRKSFTSKRAALMFEAEQRELAHPKQNARGQALRQSSSRSRQAAKAITSKPPLRSSQQRAISDRTSLPLLMLSKSMKRSGAGASQTQHAKCEGRSSARISGTSGNTTARRNSTILLQKSQVSVHGMLSPVTRSGKRS